MKFEIKDSLTIKEVQTEFSKHFPYLKIEFFSKPHKINEGSNQDNLLSSNLKLIDCRTKHYEGSFYINPHNTVSNLEQSFQEIFGLSIQVFKRFGIVWIETSVTDNWTLAKQNEEANLYNSATEEIKSSKDNILLS